MYRIEYLEPGMKNHTGTKFTECRVWQGNKVIKVLVGPLAKIKAKEFVHDHAWLANEPVAA